MSTDITIPEGLHPILRMVAEEIEAAGVIDPPEQPDSEDPNRLSYPVGHATAIEVERLDDGTLQAALYQWGPDHGLLHEVEIGDPVASVITVAASAAEAIKNYHLAEARFEAEMSAAEEGEQIAAIAREERDALDGMG